MKYNKDQNECNLNIKINTHGRYIHKQAEQYMHIPTSIYINLIQNIVLYINIMVKTAIYKNIENSFKN